MGPRLGYQLNLLEPSEVLRLPCKGAKPAGNDVALAHVELVSWPCLGCVSREGALAPGTMFLANDTSTTRLQLLGSRGWASQMGGGLAARVGIFACLARSAPLRRGLNHGALRTLRFLASTLPRHGAEPSMLT